MFQTQLISQVVDWERRLEIEEERRKNMRQEPYVNYLAAAQATPQAEAAAVAVAVAVAKERRSIFARIFGRSKEQKRPEYPCYPTERCGETQAG